MKNISRFFEHIYSFLIPFFLSTSLTIAFSNICEIGISTNTILVAGLIISSLFMFYKIDVTRMVILVMLGLFVLTVVMVLIFDGQLIINEASSFIYYCTSTNIAYDRGYARLIGILVVFVINAVLFISDWVYILRAIIAVGLFGGAVTLTVFNINIPKYAIFSLVIYILSIAIETSNVINNRKIKSKEVKIYSTNLLPICLACAIIIIIIPTSEKPINWQPVINL